MSFKHSSEPSTQFEPAAMTAPAVSTRNHQGGRGVAVLSFYAQVQYSLQLAEETLSRPPREKFTGHGTYLRKISPREPLTGKFLWSTTTLDVLGAWDSNSRLPKHGRRARHKPELRRNQLTTIVPQPRGPQVYMPKIFKVASYSMSSFRVNSNQLFMR